jgi:hypothetical protein
MLWLLTFVSSVFLVWFGFALRGWADSRREDRSIRSHIDALGMEIRYCGELAAEYLHQRIQAPLYRLPNEAYRVVLPRLLREGLIGGAQARALQRFYLQVEQVNRGLDNVDDFLRGRTAEQAGQGITLQGETDRLQLKAQGLRGVGHGEDASDLYKKAFAAFKTIVGNWLNRSWWRRFKKTYVRPTQERLIQFSKRRPWAR